MILKFIALSIHVTMMVNLFLYAFTLGSLTASLLGFVLLLTLPVYLETKIVKGENE